MNISKLMAKRIEPSNSRKSAAKRRMGDTFFTKASLGGGGFHRKHPDLEHSTRTKFDYWTKHQHKTRPKSALPGVKAPKPPRPSEEAGATSECQASDSQGADGPLGLIGLTQAGCEIRHSSNVGVRHAVCDVMHHGAIGTVAAAEQFELLGNVGRMLASQTRELTGHASAIRRVASGTGGYTALGQTTAPDLLATFHGVFFGSVSSLFPVHGLLRQVKRHVLHIFFGHAGRNGGHQAVGAFRATTGRQGFFVLGTEIVQLLDQVLVRLVSQRRVDRNNTVAAIPVTGHTGQHATRHLTLQVELLAFGGIWLGQTSCIGHVSGKNHRASHRQAACDNDSGKRTLHLDLDNRESIGVPHAPRKSHRKPLVSTQWTTTLLFQIERLYNRR